MTDSALYTYAFTLLIGMATGLLIGFALLVASVRVEAQRKGNYDA